MSELKINLGCGSNRLDGWSNHDNDVDITKPLPWLYESADCILIEHCLEHVNCADGFRFLKESYRILKKRGGLRICVPKALEMPTEDHCRDLILGHGHQMIYNEHILARMMVLAGFQNVCTTRRKDCDGHWKVIGRDKDDLETLRMEGTK